MEEDSEAIAKRVSLKGTISNGYSTTNRSFLSWSWSARGFANIRETNVLSPEELKRLVHLFVCGVVVVVVPLFQGKPIVIGLIKSQLISCLFSLYCDEDRSFCGSTSHSFLCP